MVTEEFKKDLQDNYNGTNSQYFVKKYKVKKNVVYNWAKKLKVTSPPKRNDHLETEVFRLYFEEKLTIKQIHERLNISKCCIDKMLRKRGGGRSNKEMHLNKIELDVNFFEKLDTPEKAYWFGFIAADGNIYLNRLQIGLAPKDENHLILFSRRIKYGGKIHQDRKGKKLVIVREKLVKDLKNLGLEYKKTFKLNENIFSKVPRQYITAFMHGYFDGDGSFSKKKSGQVYFSLVGNESFLLAYARLLQEFGIKHGEIKKDKRTKQTFYFCAYVNNQIDKFKNLFYIGDNQSKDFLQRKKEKLF